jgi:arylsulfatase A-like enzyme
LQQLVSLIDLPPTLLDAAGIQVPEQMQGNSLMSLLRGESAAWPEEVYVQISESEVGRAVRAKRWKYGVTAPHQNADKDSGSERYVESYLYDLQCDPYELTNLIGLESHREAADVMMARLCRRMQETGESVPEIDKATAIPAGQRRVSELEARS